MRIGNDFYAAGRFFPESERIQVPYGAAMQRFMGALDTRLTHALNFASINDLRGFWQLATIMTTFDSTDIKAALDPIEVGKHQYLPQ